MRREQRGRKSEHKGRDKGWQVTGGGGGSQNREMGRSQGWPQTLVAPALLVNWTGNMPTGAHAQ